MFFLSRKPQIRREYVYVCVYGGDPGCYIRESRRALARTIFRLLTYGLLRGLADLDPSSESDSEYCTKSELETQAGPKSKLGAESLEQILSLANTCHPREPKEVPEESVGHVSAPPPPATHLPHNNESTAIESATDGIAHVRPTHTTLKGPTRLPFDGTGQERERKNGAPRDRRDGERGSGPRALENIVQTG